MFRKFILASLMAVTITSCSYHIGSMTGNAHIDNENFQIVDFAIGSFSCWRVLGMGGTRNESMVLDAKRNLYLSHPLEKGQALANVTVDFCKKNYVLFGKTKVIVSAEIVDFRQGVDISTDSVNLALSSTKLLEHKGFYLNEEIYAKVGEKYKLCRIEKLMKRNVMVKFNEEGIGSKEYDYKAIFKIRHGETIKAPLYSLNETVVFLKETENSWKKVKGKIKAIGAKGDYIVEYEFEGKDNDSVLDERRINRADSEN